MDDEKDRDVELLKKAAESLGEHFDSVQIFASRHEPETENGTVSCNEGTGNWFARIGQVREWLIRRDEESKEAVRKED